MKLINIRLHESFRNKNKKTQFDIFELSFYFLVFMYFYQGWKAPNNTNQVKIVLATNDKIIYPLSPYR